MKDSTNIENEKTKNQTGLLVMSYTVLSNKLRDILTPLFLY